MSTLPRKYCIVKLSSSIFESVVSVCETIEEAEQVQKKYNSNDPYHDYIIWSVITQE